MRIKFILILFGIMPALYVVQAQQVIYTSPLHKAELVSRYSNVILHFDLPLSEAQIHDIASVTITGSKSGEIAHSLYHLNDRRKCILQPAQPWQPGERVTVDWPSWIDSQDKTARFMISPLKAEAHGDLTVEQRSDTLPDGFPEISINMTNDATPGDLLLSLAVSSEFKLVRLDNSGHPVSYTEDQAIVRYTNFAPAGDDTYIYHVDPPGVEAMFYVIDENFERLDSFHAGPGYVADSHDAIILDNGNALVLVYDRQPVDMSMVVAGGNPNAFVTGLIIQEVDNLNNVIWEWRSWDHFEITDGISQASTSLIDFTGSNISYVHANSLELDLDGNIILSSRNMHEVTKIDRTTGNIIWRLGGKNNQFAFDGDTLGFTDQHDARIVAPGRLTVFDNGNFHDAPLSRVVEYAIDEQNLTATLVWKFDNPYGSQSIGSGNAQRLDNGHTLIGWGAISPNSAPVVTEVDADGNVVFELSFFDGVEYRTQYSYRWFRVVSDTTTSINEVQESDQHKIYPNPTSSVLQIESGSAGQNIAEVSVFAPDGQFLVKFSDLNSPKVRLELPELASGRYFLALEIEGRRYWRKVVLINH